MAIVALLVLSLQDTVLTQRSSPAEIPSPDHKHVAEITDVHKKPGRDTESILRIRNADGKKVLFKKDYTNDGEHGDQIHPVGWTADSRYFVYTLSHAGGHMPWNQPVDVYSVDSNFVYHLADYLDPITIDQRITLGPPDSLFVTIVGDTTGLGYGFELKNLRISLDSMLAGEKGE